MQLRSATERSWIVKYRFMNNVIERRFDSVVDADNHVYQIIAHAAEELEILEFSRLELGKKYLHHHSMMFKRWNFLIKCIGALEVVTV